MLKPLIMTAVMVAVSTGTYYGLKVLPPGTLPPPIGLRPKDEAPQPGAQDAFVASAETPQEPAAAAPQAAPAEAPMTEQDLAEEPAPEAAPQAQPAAPEPAPTMQAQAEPEPEPQAEPSAAAPSTSAPAQPPPDEKPDPSWGGRAKPPASATKPKTQDSTTVARAGSATPAEGPAPATKKKPPEADVLKPWWPNPEKMPANQLKLQYAGQVKGEEAIALLFTSPVNLDTLKQHTAVRTTTGQKADGDWELGKNPRLAVFRGVKPGRYTVILRPQVADQKGFMLGTTLQGPVYIKEP